jgi:tetratricopeptide (TPR) repeat protein
MMRFPHALVALGTVLLLTAVPAAQAPQQAPPPPLTNLQVIPKDTPRPEVVAAMQAFNQALGVGCDYCHVGQQPNVDFASDDKPTKLAGRQMLILMRDLNTKIPAAVNKSATDATRVQCATCHRGVAIPKQLSEILSKTSTEKGIPAAIDEFRDLRKRYFGGQSYDFSENGLIALAQPSIAANKADEALSWLQVNLEFYPKSARTYLAMAQANQRKNDKDLAIKNVEKALELEPENAAAKRQLDQLKRP